MSTINLLEKPTVPNGQTVHAPPHQQPALTPERLNTLLRAGPNWSAASKSPDPSRQASPEEAKATKSLHDLRELLTEGNIQQVFRDPKAKQSREILEQAHALLTQGNINTVAKGANATTNVSLLGTIGNQLTNDRLDPFLASAIKAAGRAMINEQQLKFLDSISGLFEGDGLESGVRNSEHFIANLENLKRNFGDMEATKKSLTNFGGLLTKDKLDVASKSAPEAQSTAENAPLSPSTYRFSAIEESPLDSPLEIRTFRRGDKIDLSGIRSQLNKPLQPVEQLSGASAEVQLRYLAATNTSVIAITGNPGSAPFVVKVFGEVRRDNLIT